MAAPRSSEFLGELRCSATLDIGTYRVNYVQLSPHWRQDARIGPGRWSTFNWNILSWPATKTWKAVNLEIPNWILCCRTGKEVVFEPCHGKSHLKIFVIVIPKEGLEGRPCQSLFRPCRSLFGYDTDYNTVLCCLHWLYSIVGVKQKEGLAGPCRPILLLAWQRQRS